MCLDLKNIVGCRLTKDEIGIIQNYLNTNDFKSHSIFWKEHCDAVGFLLIAFDKQVHRESIDSTVNEYVIAYKNYFRLLNGSCTISKFVSSIKRNLNGNSESLFNPKRFNKLVSASIINKLNTPCVYQDIDYTSTSDLLFMLSFITSSYDKLGGYTLLLKGLSNGMMRMNDRKDTIGDYKLLEAMEVILKNNWITTDELIVYLDRILLIAGTMNEYHIENDVHERTMELLQKYDFKAAEYYYNQILRISENHNSLHYDFAKSLILRGRNVDDIEKCLSYITSYFDRTNQKLSWDGFYYKISIYLSIAICDYYSANLQNEYYIKACEEIDDLENSGWNRELKTAEYDIYSKLCKARNKEMDVNKEKEIEYSYAPQIQKNDVLQNS